MSEHTEQDTNCEYQKLNEYCKNNKLTFDIENEPTITDFSNVIGEKIHLVARCVLNTRENFPLKTRKDGTQTKRQREYYEEDPNYKGKKVDYIPEDENIWNDCNNEWLYCLTYNDRIVKIGMTITSLKERWCGSYSCGTTRAMSKGSCSTTNYIITECNFTAVHNNMNVNIYAICCPKRSVEVTRFNETKTIDVSTVRGYETMLTKCFSKKYNKKPVLCVQEGK